MLRTKLWIALAAFGIAVVGVGCDRSDDSITGIDDPSLNIKEGRTYSQVEFLGNPLVSEVTVSKADHEAYNFTMPYNTAQFVPVTKQFITGFGRPQALADLISSLLYNSGKGDMLLYYPDRDPATAGWLSWALQPGVGAGGRKLTDDVVDRALTAVFSSFLDPNGALCQPFQLPLCTDNVGTPAANPSSTFPYLAAGF